MEFSKKPRTDEDYIAPNEKADQQEEESDSGSESDDSSSSEEPPEIGLDQNGRIVPGVKGPVDYGFHAFGNCIKAKDEPAKWQELMEDCKTVFTARQAEEDETYSAGQTFFIAADQTPKTALEALALDVFNFHAQGLTYDKATSGAEWWTLVIEEDSDVAVHWDKDYHLEDYCVNVFPQIGTVTYLSELGGPTMVIQKTAPPRPIEDASGKSNPISFCSKPQIGKHICFDGRYLHLASNDFSRLFKQEGAGNQTDKPRVTFLVNVWFNHHPKDAVPLDDSIKPALKLPPKYRLWTGAPREELELTPDTLVCENPASMIKTEYPLTSGDREYKVHINIPPTSCDKSVVLLKYNTDTVPSISTNNKNQ
mmetsp:Transcript_4626/g.8143  ORF Transcript_4626/g.8143 Transcript_4626/m.8143 type:complete len:366 (-) Transcript_4626:8332-9429(-)